MDPVSKKPFSDPTIVEEASLTEVTLQTDCPVDEPL
jgi:hypothetical protein